VHCFVDWAAPERGRRPRERLDEQGEEGNRQLGALRKGHSESDDSSAKSCGARKNEAPSTRQELRADFQACWRTKRREFLDHSLFVKPGCSQGGFYSHFWGLPSLTDAPRPVSGAARGRPVRIAEETRRRVRVRPYWQWTLQQLVFCRSTEFFCCSRRQSPVTNGP